MNQEKADWLKLGNLVLDGSIDLIESGHTSELLSGGPLLRVLSKLILEVLEVISTLPNLFSEVIFKRCTLLWVVDLQVEVNRVTVDSYGGEGVCGISCGVR